VLPATIVFGGTTYTDAEFYSMIHMWSGATVELLTGMTLYLRSLTPTGQGCVLQGVTGQCENVAANPGLECGE
jgi:hypothetical protein